MTNKKQTDSIIVKKTTIVIFRHCFIKNFKNFIVRLDSYIQDVY